MNQVDLSICYIKSIARCIFNLCGKVYIKLLICRINTGDGYRAPWYGVIAIIEIMMFVAQKKMFPVRIRLVSCF